MSVSDLNDLVAMIQKWEQREFMREHDSVFLEIGDKSAIDSCAVVPESVILKNVPLKKTAKNFPKCNFKKVLPDLAFKKIAKKM